MLYACDEGTKTMQLKQPLDMETRSIDPAFNFTPLLGLTRQKKAYGQKVNVSTTAAATLATATKGCSLNKNPTANCLKEYTKRRLD